MFDGFGWFWAGFSGSSWALVSLLSVSWFVFDVTNFFIVLSQGSQSHQESRAVKKEGTRFAHHPAHQTAEKCAFKSCDLYKSKKSQWGQPARK